MSLRALADDIVRISDAIRTSGLFTSSVAESLTQTSAVRALSRQSSGGDMPETEPAALGNDQGGHWYLPGVDVEGMDAVDAKAVSTVRRFVRVLQQARELNIPGCSLRDVDLAIVSAESHLVGYQIEEDVGQEPSIPADFF